MTHDKAQSMFDTSTIVFIVLTIVLVVGFVYAKSLGGSTSVPDSSAVEYQAAVEERIRPFGRIKLPGEEHGPGELRVDEVPPAEPVATLMSGPQVFNAACIVCHGTGIGGAPTLEDGAAWEPRIAQGMDTLYQHALEGYTGTMGYMPPKGARLDLSDKEVSDAVDYMLAQVPN